MKKILSALIIFYAMIFSANCSAADYYVGNYSDGAKAYLMTGTILRHDITATDGTGSLEYTFKVKAVYSNSSRIDDYKFDAVGGYFYINGKRRTGKRENGEYWSEVEKNIVKYINQINWNR